MSDGPLFLGVDLGSQSLKLFIVDQHLEPVTESSVQFDSDLPHYQTTNGFHHFEGGRVTCPAGLWVEALERGFAGLKAKKAPLDRVVGISGSAQQHGSVYLNKGTLHVLQNLDAGRTLLEQLGGCFTVPECPVWMDSSTTRECKELESAVGGADALAKVTGSVAYERFTGNQIAKLIKDHPKEMAECERICLVSSFLASLLAGTYAPIDVSDGSGMNLLDIHRRAWCPAALAGTGKGYPLGPRLGGVVDSHQEVGVISQFWTSRYGLPKECSVFAFSGDNNNALVGLKLGGKDIAISLGTSDTLFTSLAHASPGRTGHVFAHPVLPGQYMAMLCYSNGSLTREFVNGGTDWDAFNRALQNTPPGNGGRLGFYYKSVEIAPQGAQGVHRFDPSGRRVDTFGKEEDVRGVVESQCMRMRLHATRLGLEISPEKRIFVTGGASRSTPLLQVIADVFGCPVFKDAKGAVQAAAFGAAMRAVHGWTVQRRGGDAGELYESMLAAKDTAEKLVSPRPEASRVYASMLEKYARIEGEIARGAGASNL
eukprot:Hpha_TRINITY_DN11098_c0_g2::TRINITY_DN11098_c0_g2_i2::g.92655::m.92655/K00854/xylB, XYLB; xylulokinase